MVNFRKDDSQKQDRDIHFHHLFNIVLEVLATAIRREENNKRHQNWKGRSKTLIIAGDRILYIEKPKDYTKEVPYLINGFSKVAGYKINIQKSVAFLYINNELLEIETKKTIPLTIALEIIPWN